MILLDTSGLIFWTLDPKMLSQKASTTIEESEQLAISSISIWEIGIKLKSGKLLLPLPLRDYVDRLKLLDKFTILPVNEGIWIKNVELEWDHKDPADRTIVATASILACPLITSDDKIRRFYSDSIW